MEKYLILKGYAGLGDRLSSLGYAIKLATQKNRTLLIDWTDELWCHSDNKGFFYYLNLINLPSNLKIIYGDEEVKAKLIELDNKELSIDPIIYKNNLTNHFHTSKIFVQNDNINIMLKRFNESETDILVLCFNFLDSYYSISKYLKFNDANFKKYDIAIHYRNTDKKNDIVKFLNRIEEFKNKIDFSNKSIYISTDDLSSIEKFKNHIGDCFDYNKKFVKNNNGIHKMNKLQLEEFNITKEELNNILLTELKILINCDHFIPSYSSCLSNVCHALRDFQSKSG